MCIHAQGDRAIEAVLDAYAAGGARPGQEPAPAPHRARRRDVPAARGPGGGAGHRGRGQPGFLSALGDGFAEALPGRSDELYAFASWRRAGITVAGSSDAPVITASPLVGIRDAVLRRTGSGRVLGPGEHLTGLEALALYTRGAAFAMHREKEIGSLEPGKLADFVVLDRNPLETDPARIAEISVLATVVDGRPVHQSASIVPGG